MNILKLRIGSQNIQGGLIRKLDFNDFSNIVHKFDIFCMQESWLTENNSVTINGYDMFRSERKKAKKLSSGGVIILFKSHLSKGMTKIKSNYEDFVWAKLDKNFFGLENDVYLCNCYIPPSNSNMHLVRNNDPFDILEQEILEFGNLGDVIILGDTNSRTGRLQEQYSDHFNPYNDNITINDNYDYEPLIRGNEDSTINEFGRKLFNVLENTHLLILNGRMVGDLNGVKTCHTYNGSSTVDYGIVSLNLASEIHIFKVLSQQWYSDHNPIYLELKINRNVHETSIDIELTKNFRYIWTEEGKNKFVELLSSSEYEDKFKCFSQNKYKKVSEATGALVNILQEAANACLILKETSITSDRPHKEGEYQNNQLVPIKREYKKVKRQYNNDKNNVNKRMLFIIQRRKYKKMQYLLHKYKKEDKLLKLAEMEKSDPKLFWKSIKKIINPKTPEQNIGSNHWVTYFKSLLNVNNNSTSNQFLTYVTTSLPTIENCSNGPGPLDDIISDTELEKAIKGLKNGKSCGPDMISNEMLKYGGQGLKEAVRHLFNLILDAGEYPKQWRKSIITPIFKCGSRMDPTNYRGVAVSDSMGKLFSKLLNTRISDYMHKNGLWRPDQNGFMSKMRTEDNIFILHTIFQQLVKKEKKKVYTVFVDFRKFFDTINRDLLKYKLVKYGITGKVYNIIKSAYSESEYCVKLKQGKTEYFKSNSGVKQGCSLSPTLSNIFQNDLHEIFGSDCDPVKLGDLELNSLSWADDLVLLSNSKSGAQNCLNKLHDYCVKWNISVNVLKTKCMVFSNANQIARTQEPLYYDGKELEYVKCYKYLGIEIQNNGNYREAIEMRVQKAKVACGMIKHAISTTHNVSVKLALSLFDKQVSPILLYGSSIWSVPEINKLIIFECNHLNYQANVQAKQAINNLLQRDANIEWSKIKREDNQVILKLCDIDDKFELLQSYKKNQTIYPFVIKDPDNFKNNDRLSEIERVHTNFCKFSLGISKYASSVCVMNELCRYPLKYKAWSLASMYWLRLEKGTQSKLVNTAYGVCKNEKHDLYQNMYYLFCKNGLRSIWMNASSLHDNYFKCKLINRLKDQYQQSLDDTLLNNDKYETYKLCKTNNVGEQGIGQYLNEIHSPNIRRLFTKLRFDYTKLKGSYNNFNLNFNNKTSNDRACDFCGARESVQHFVCVCDKFSSERSSFLAKINKVVNVDINTVSSGNLLGYILNLNFPGCKTNGNSITVDSSCSFIKKIWEMRFGVNYM